ncbi:hypothetical protein ANCCAN_02037 [Ancylostoma caninum]|uniref:Uncharacterized protein n=1 Tax=Ancylostoma caninum TaxID=29170 RepID=A0A368H8L0_ANCCA|nr:hypothetical protein ANCCAN_02037 [Ancylostoma caninum]
MSDVSITGVDVYRLYVLPALGELIGTCLFTLFAVSISQLVMRRLDAPTAVTYVFVQSFGAFLGAVLFRALVSNAIFVDYFIGSYITTEGSLARSQGFFLDVILSAVVCLSYLTFDYRFDNLQISCTWTLVSYFSLPLIGQSGNVALSSANAIVHHIFTGDGTSTSHLYLHFSAGLIAIVLSSFILWLLNSPMARKDSSERPKPELQSKSSGTC